MAKQKLKLTISGKTIAAPIWDKKDVHWESNKVGCPYCALIKRVKAVCDVLQYGLVDHDLCITVLECRACNKCFAVRYTIDHMDGDINDEVAR